MKTNIERLAEYYGNDATQTERQREYHAPLQRNIVVDDYVFEQAYRTQYAAVYQRKEPTPSPANSVTHKYFVWSVTREPGEPEGLGILLAVTTSLDNAIDVAAQQSQP